MKKPTFSILIQNNQGNHQPFTCEVSESKINKIIELVQTEIKKKKKKMACSSITLDRFFSESTLQV
tara:strand:+ start:114 stop:311 length:198 start_codon:yes stop_codon:yes gene_type:complete